MGVGFFYFRLKTSTSFHPQMRWIVLIITLVALFMSWQNAMARVNRPDRMGNIRADFWENSQQVWKQFPIFGTGFGNFKHISFLNKKDNKTEWLTHSHNEYLEILSDGGIIGAGLFFGVLGLLGFSLFKMWRIRHHMEVKILGLAVLVSLVGAAFHSLFDYALRIPANGFLLTLILGLGIKIVLYKREIRHEK
jgi:O-antigen ligase